MTTAQARQSTLDAAWAAHPERFSRRPQPKVLELPETAWINKPEASTDEPVVQAA